MATGQAATLQDENKRHELVYDMLDGRKTAKRSRQGRSTVGALKRGPRGTMIDWTAVFATLPDQFTLDTMIAHKTAGEKTRAYLMQVVVRWSKEVGSSAPAGACTRKPNFRRNWTGPTEPRLNSSLRTDSFAEVMEHDGDVPLAVSWSSSKSHLPRVGQALFGGCGGRERS